MNTNTKLVVEVVDAQDLLPKDGEGSASPFVEVEFLNQVSKTKTIPKNLNPIWQQKLVFDYDKSRNYNHQHIEVSVYHERRPVPGRCLLGRVRIPCSNIVKKSEEVYQSFRLESKWFFSSVRGEIGLKIYISSEINPKFPLFQSQPDNTPVLPQKTSVGASKDGDLSVKAYSVTVPETEDSVSDSPKSVPTPEKEVSSVTGETELVVNDESKEVTEETLEPDKERGQELHKHQAVVQPVLSFKKEPAAASSTRMHSIRLRSRGSNADPNAYRVKDTNPHNAYGVKDMNPQNAYGATDMNHPNAYEVKDMNPPPGDGWRNSNGVGYGGRRGWMSGGERSTSTYDLVEQMFYLYVRVVKAKDLPASSITGSSDPYVEVKLGNYRGRTKHIDRRVSQEWNQVFAFSKERIQSSVLEVFVKDKETIGRDDYLGRVVFDLNEIPTRVPPDSPLAPQWYRLEDRREGKVRGDVMLAVWMGTQADEAFSEAWHADSASVNGEGVFNIRSKVYISPKLWYLRVNVIEAQDVIPNDRSRAPDVFIKANVGNQILKTRICPAKTINPIWNEDLVFVVAEPFEEQLLITVEDRVHPSKDEVLGKISLPLNVFEKRLDHRPVQSRWFNLEKYGFGVLEPDRRKEMKFSSRVHLRVCLEGGYHVLDESTMYISDTRPTARQLWKQPIGVLEVGILGAKGIFPMKLKDGRGSTDAYCVAKYGQKWVRTRTILDALNPRWNEQYTWEVYDPSTVITLGVFDNCHLNSGGTEKPPPGSTAASLRDARIGKV